MKSGFRRVPAYTSQKLIKQSYNGRKRVIWVHFLWYYGTTPYMTMFVTSFLLLFVLNIFILYYWFLWRGGRRLLFYFQSDQLYFKTCWILYIPKFFYLLLSDTPNLVYSGSYTASDGATGGAYGFYPVTLSLGDYVVSVAVTISVMNMNTN